MKRDMELIREILFEIEKNHDGSGQVVRVAVEGRPQNDVIEHLFMLTEAGLIESVDSSTMSSRNLLVMRMTWEGYEYLDAVRDPVIWRKTRERAQAVVGVGFGFMWEIAKAEIKTKLGLA